MIRTSCRFDQFGSCRRVCALRPHKHGSIVYACHEHSRSPTLLLHKSSARVHGSRKCAELCDTQTRTVWTKTLRWAGGRIETHRREHNQTRLQAIHQHSHMPLSPPALQQHTELPFLRNYSPAVVTGRAHCVPTSMEASCMHVTSTAEAQLFFCTPSERMRPSTRTPGGRTDCV